MTWIFCGRGEYGGGGGERSRSKGSPQTQCTDEICIRGRPTATACGVVSHGLLLLRDRGGGESGGGSIKGKNWISSPAPFAMHFVGLREEGRRRAQVSGQIGPADSEQGDKSVLFFHPFPAPRCTRPIAHRVIIIMRGERPVDHRAARRAIKQSRLIFCRASCSQQQHQPRSSGSYDPSDIVRIGFSICRRMDIVSITLARH